MFDPNDDDPMLVLLQPVDHPVGAPASRPVALEFPLQRYSRRAKALLLQTGMVAPGQETQGVTRVLNAAAWTYVAAFLTSLAYFLWFLLPLITGSRRN